jgi:hypothetical protein
MLYLRLSLYNYFTEICRAAEKFIYIENQYFLGSAYAWTEGTSNNSFEHGDVL